jgi:hypothetical protein
MRSVHRYVTNYPLFYLPKLNTMDYSEIRKIVESCHLNFLIGSGASKPFFDTLNQIESLLTELSIKDKLTSDEYAIIDVSIKQFYFEKCIEGNIEIPKGSGAVLEETQNSYDEFLKSLQIILSNRRSNLVSRQVNLFTTNMDLFIDWSLEKQKLSFNDGFTGRLKAEFGTENFHNIIRKTSSHYDYQSEVPLFNLFKIHGSVNWILPTNGIQYDYGLRTLQSIKDSKVEVGKTCKIVWDKEGKQVYHSIDEIKELVIKNKISRDKVHDKFLTNYDNLVMINPTKKKFETTTRDLTFYELLRMYSNHLERENSVLFVIGFSFADEHIREITKRVAVSNPTLIIIIFSYNKDSRDSIAKLLPSTPNIKYVFDSRDGNDAVKYTLKEVNDRFFGKLAQQLEKGEFAKSPSTESNQDSTDAAVKS